MHLRKGIALAAALLLFFVDDASAYLDPGTGSFIFQTIVAMVLGAAFTLKLYWRRLKGLFGRKSAAPADDGGAAGEKDQGGPS
jgi:hypothetical protein